MRKTLLLALLTLLSFGASAQTAASYSFAASSGTYTPMSGGTTVSIFGDDVTVASIPLGFTFNFCGSPYTSVSICSNGWISFSNSTSTQWTNSLANANTLGPLLMPLFDDLGGTSAPSATYQTTGTSPNRVFTMEWNQWEWNVGTNDSIISFQVKLFEGTDVIQYIYNQGPNSQSGSASIGIVKSTTDYQALTSTSSSPTSSTTTFTTSLNSKPASGQIYQWTPPPPCTGTPTAGTAVATPNPACPSAPFTLSTTGGSVSAPGITYQWQSAPSTTGPWTNITGATTNPYTVAAGITTTTSYRLIVTCVPTTNTSTSTVTTVTLNSFINCYCTSTATSTGDDDIGQVKIGSSFANPTSTPSPLTNNASAVNLYTDFTALTPTNVTAGVSTSWEVTQIDQFSTFYSCGLAVYIDYNHNGLFTDPGELVNTPTLGPTTATSPTFTGSFIVPMTALAGNTRMRFVLVESTTSISPCGTYTWGETEDYLINIVFPPPCTGAPTAGTASSNPTAVCPGVPFTLTDVGFTVGSSMSYRWQSSPAGANTWTSIPGATSSVYVVSAGISAATDYRFVDTCLPSGLSAISNTVSVTVNSFLNCYCTSTATATGDDDIGQFTLGSFANPTTAPSPIVNNPTANKLYTDFTGLGGIPLFVNQTTPFSMLQIEGFGTFYSCYLKIFIDYNHDGLFTGTGETVFSGAGPTLASNPLTGSITVPTTALTGLTRLRLVLVESGSAASVNPCGTYTWGETEDYLVNILSQTPPPPNVVTNSPLCPGTNLVVTVTPAIAGYTGVSYAVNGPGFSSSNTSGVFTIPNVSAANAGAYTATMSSSGFTSNPTNFNVVVNTVPVVTITNVTPPTSCTTSNGSIQLNNLVPNTNYTLSFRKNNVQQTQQSITSSGTGTYVLGGLAAATYDSIRVRTPAPQNCWSAPIAVAVPAPTAPPTPFITAQANPVCITSTLTLTVPNPIAGGIYSWTGPNGYNPTTNTTNTATRANMQLADSGEYGVTVTVNGCVSARDTIKVFVLPKDAPPIPNNVTYCQFENALPLTAQGQNLLWYKNPSYPIDSALNNGSPIGPIPSTAVATTPPGIIYYVSQTITCESPRVPITVTVKPKPAPPTIPVPVIQVCQFEQAPPPAASGVQVRWFATPTGGVGSATAPTPNTLVSGTFYYYASQTVNGCESDRAIVTVIVKPKPAPPAVTSPLNLCQGDPIGPVSALGQNLLWYATPVGGIGVPVAPVPTTGYEDSFKYFVSQTVNGCESDRALMAVFVNYRPNGIITGTSPWVCQDEDLSFNYYGNARPDAQYAWYAPPGTKAVSGGTTQGPFVVHFDSAGTRVIRLTINNKGCISDLISAPITVRPLPVITYVNRQDVCEDELVTIALSSQTNNITGFNFNFGSDDAIVEYSAGTGGPFGVRYPKSGHYQVAATATANMCTSKPLIQDIYVHEQPDATITPGKSPIDICASDTLFLSVKPVSEGAVYTWTPGAYFQGKRDSLNNQVFAVVSQNSQVKVHIKTAFGCEATDSIKVTTKPCCGVFFPNAFAPTGNVVQNRMFRPITNGVHRVNSFRVVNRWGQVLYESKVERNGWDGTYNGVPQDMGTYYYYISYKCEGKDVEERGEFILLR